MTRLGMEQVLASEGIEVVGEEREGEQLVAAAQQLRPDAVVLGMQDDSVPMLGERVRAAAPGSKVILWNRDEDTMQVFDPGCPRPRRISPPLLPALVGEFAGDRPSFGRN